MKIFFHNKAREHPAATLLPALKEDGPNRIAFIVSLMPPLAARIAARSEAGLAKRPLLGEVLERAASGEETPPLGHNQSRGRAGPKPGRRPGQIRTRAGSDRIRPDHIRPDRNKPDKALLNRTQSDKAAPPPAMAAGRIMPQTAPAAQPMRLVKMPERNSGATNCRPSETGGV